MSFNIGGIQKTTLIDFPEKIACIVFTQGCNFLCGYCHNPELFNLSEPIITLSAFFAFLKSRKGKLDGVVITGGEPTLQKDLKPFIQNVKDLGFAVKLDTNGTKPSLLKELYDENLLDYVAMDIKAPLEKYSEITRVKVDTSKIQESINLIMNSGVDYEFRTTVLKNQLSLSDFEEIGELIKGSKHYYLQKFVPTKTLLPELITEKTYSKEEFDSITKILEKSISHVEVR